MLHVIKRLKQSLTTAGSTKTPAAFTDLQVAAAVLLLEVSSSDFEHRPEEKSVILQALTRAYGLNEEQLKILYEHAVHSAGRAVSLYDFIAIINRECSREQKMLLLEQLWRVAFADGRLDKYEDHRIRWIAELLHMPHRAFIQSKHAAAAGGGESLNPERA
jgi:uncharacterized tellurite resistance protein B-like protein